MDRTTSNDCPGSYWAPVADAIVPACNGTACCECVAKTCSTGVYQNNMDEGWCFTAGDCNGAGLVTSQDCPGSNYMPESEFLRGDVPGHEPQTLVQAISNLKDLNWLSWDDQPCVSLFAHKTMPLARHHIVAFGGPSLFSFVCSHAAQHSYTWSGNTGLASNAIQYFDGYQGPKATSNGNTYPEYGGEILDSAWVVDYAKEFDNVCKVNLCKTLSSALEMPKFESGIMRHAGKHYVLDATVSSCILNMQDCLAFHSNCSGTMWCEEQVHCM